MFAHVFHPTDFSPVSQIAFAHALRFALAARGTLAVLHVAADGREHPASSFPQVRRTLAAWGLVAPDCRPEEVARLGVRIKKVEIGAEDPTEAIADYLGHRQMDLIVLATHQRGGLQRLAHPAVALPIMQSTRLPSLFIPPGTEGFVRFDTGGTALRRVLVPVVADPAAQPAVDAAAEVGRLLGDGPLDLTLLHVGDERDFPRLLTTAHPDWTWNRISGAGAVDDAVLEAARAGGTDLLVMTTRGPKGFLGALRGSTAARIVHGAPCPVLAVPNG